ncbi:hypothetical protein KDW_46210 [Dictyobacter vulcani]|uniref:Membrane transport protein MMPL domain-containing protein n=2 Tax=Dictyobacter vulcani TaxID=2607529 RepID=A0A5J4KWF4_9CHLR|nr:hypothetical protein KDW_46210 [Dictyobacter vulcani]
MTLIANLTGSSSDTKFQNSVKQMRDHLKTDTANTSVQAYVTGPAGVITDTVLIFGSVDVKLLLATVALVLVLLIVLYRSLILALLPLIGVGWALQITNALLGFLGKSGAVGISQQATSIMTVLLFGAGTDYCIFIASRFREELALTEDKHTAMRTTMRAVGEAITSSAGTVILGLLTLLFTYIGLYYSLGPALVTAIFVMLLAGLTLVPALLVWLGRAAYWPFVPKYNPALQIDSEEELKGFWGRLGTWTARHRVVAIVGSTVFLIILALGNIGSLPTFNFLTAFRDPTDSSKGYAILQKHFPAGTLAPTTVLVKLSGTDADAYKQLVKIDAFNAAAQKAAGVAQVQGPTRPTGKDPLVDPAKLQNTITTLPAPVRDSIRSGKQPSMPTQPPTTGKPPIGGQQPPTTGKPPTGQQPPTTGKPPIGGKPPVTGQQPPAFTPEQHTFIFLVALGADYTIFLMSRVREEVKRLGIEKGVPHAVARTGGVITSAGLILAGTFAVLTTLPLNILYQLGACVAVGILLDTFIVRGLLVPGLVLMLGKWNWWPGRL